jgi:DHA3 family macrolide efflux protein-like MFS transporter
VAGSISGIFGPVMAAALIAIIGIQGILIIDIITFIVAISCLFLVLIPNPPRTKEGLEGVGSIWKESVYGFSYVYKRRPLLGLLFIFLLMNMISTFGFTVLAPMILARTSNNEVVLGGVQSAAALGGVISGVILLVWGGPTRKIRGLFTAMAAMCVAMVFVGLGREFFVWAGASFLFSFFTVVAVGCSDAFWQSKVVPDVQGRVFSARLMLAHIAIPLSTVMAGPAADRIFEPAMKEGGYLAPVLARIINTGTGSGMGLMFVLAGLAGVAIMVLGYQFRSIREANELLPDHEAV